MAAVGVACVLLDPPVMLVWVEHSTRVRQRLHGTSATAGQMLVGRGDATARILAESSGAEGPGFGGGGDRLCDVRNRYALVCANVEGDPENR